MLFDLGNIITLAIVAIVLAIYRFLDRDNRSLEKVKKFTDRVRQDLSTHVDLRSEDLKSYGIELDVRAKAAKEVLKRVKEAEEAMSSRSDALDAMGARVADYDKILARLMDMTGRVDENLKLIHEESVFADQLARKLKDSEEALARIDAEVPVLRESFAQDARKELEAVRDGLVADARDRLDATVEEVEALRTDTEQRREQVAAFYREANEQAKSRYVEMEKLLASAFRKAQDEAERLEDATYEKFREQIEARGERLKTALDGKLKALQEAAKERVAETQGLVKGFKAEWQKEARELLDSARAEISGETERVTVRIDELGATADKAESIAAVRFDKIEQRALELAQALQTKVKDQLKAHQEELVRKQAEIRAELSKYDASGKEMEKEIRGILSGINEKMVREAAALEKKTFEDFGRRVDEYRAEVEYKFERLSESNVDIKSLEEALRSAMAGTERRVEEDFALFGKDLAGRQRAFEEEILSEATRVRGNMEAVEKEINVLKASAYQNVSEKLQVFEDAFFADLKARSEEIDRRLEGWQGTLEERLETLSGEAQAASREHFKSASQELAASLAALQQSLFDEMGKLSERTQSFRDGVTEQISAADGSLASLRESVRSDLQEARAGADAFVRAELERYRVDAQERIKEAERELESRLRSLSEAADEASRETRDGQEALAREGKAFRERIAQELASAQTGAKETYDSLHAAETENIARLAADWERQRDELTAGSRAEREALAKDLETAQADIDRFRQEFGQKITQALEGFGRNYEGLATDAQRRSREITAQIDQTIKTFQQSAREYMDQTETEAKRFTERFDREAAERDKALADMDARIKAFAAQTKLFDRTDELQTSLKDSIEVLKGELARVEARKGEIAEMETQFQRIKRLEDDTDQKVTRFLAEKRRIDNLEEGFKRLLGLSEEVDRKLASVTESRDSLTELEAEFRKLSGLAQEAGSKYERLEKKSALLDTTVDGVDKSFETLRGIEKGIKDLEQRVHPLAGRMDELREVLNSLDKGRDKVDHAVSRLGALDKDIEETEKRIEKVQKAREWLARTETRLEELNKQAQDQLKLLGSLLKQEAGSQKKEAGAPSLSAQETVRKLAHQGWKVEEIARAVKLSRGEVELILELSSQ